MSSYVGSDNHDKLDLSSEEDTHQMIEYIIAQMNLSVCAKCQKILPSIVASLLLDILYCLLDHCPGTLLDWYRSDLGQRTKENNLPAMSIKLCLSSSPLPTLATITTEATKTKEEIACLTRQLSDCRDSVERLREDCSMLQRNGEEQDRSAEELKSRQDTSEQNLVALQQQVKDLHYATEDGSFMWRIENVTQTLDDARSERQTPIYSPAFYSSSTGYKMRARMDMNGVDGAHGSSVSVSFVLCQGEHDALLKWPFKYPILFRLYDHTGSEHHIDDSITPETGSTVLQRPTSNRDIVYTIDKFCPQAVIERPGNRYVCNDTMFLRRAVDFNGQSKVPLPYTFDNQLELPTHIQHVTQDRKIQAAVKAHAQVAAAIEQNDQDVLSCALLLQHVGDSPSLM